MSNKKNHSEENFKQGFPNPGVPADEAWQQMHEMLVKHNLSTPTKKYKHRKLVLVLLLCLLVSLGTIYLLTTLNNTAENVKSKINNVTSGNNNKKSYAQSLKDSAEKNLLQNITDPVEKAPNNNSFHVNNNSLKNYQYSLSPAYTFKHIISDSTNKNITGIGLFKEEQRKLAIADNKENIADLPARKQIFENNSKDSIENNNRTDNFSLKKLSGKKRDLHKFHLGVEWNINFSTINNSHYFDAYNGKTQYYVWLLPSAWARVDISKKQGIALHIKPFYQQFAGNKIVDVQKPFIASIEPDIVTSLIKSRGFNIGLNYEYAILNKLSIAAGLNYTIQHNALYSQRKIIAFSGEVLSDSINAVVKKDASFTYIKPAYLGWNASLKYNFKKFTIGAGVSQPLTNVAAEPAYSLRPLNGEIYLQYRIK